MCLVTLLHLSAAGDSRASGRFGGNAAAEFGILGLTQAEAGRIGVYGDSNCLDSSHQRSPCFNMLLEMLKYAAEVRTWASNRLCLTRPPPNPWFSSSPCPRQCCPAVEEAMMQSMVPKS